MIFGLWGIIEQPLLFTSEHDAALLSHGAEAEAEESRDFDRSALSATSLSIHAK
jgi:hypothetical protein